MLSANCLLLLSAIVSVAIGAPMKAALDNPSFPSDISQARPRDHSTYLRGTRQKLPSANRDVVQIPDEWVDYSGPDRTDEIPNMGDGLGWNGKQLDKFFADADAERDAQVETPATRNVEEVITEQPGLVDLPPDDPLAHRLGSAYHQAGSGDISYSSYYGCKDQTGIRPSQAEQDEFIKKYLGIRPTKKWIGDGKIEGAKERTVAHYDSEGNPVFVGHGERYNKCGKCCPTWTFQARDPKWKWEAKCKTDIATEICTPSGSTTTCTTYYDTETHRVIVTPYFETRPCCCDIVGCCGRITSAFQGDP